MVKFRKIVLGKSCDLGIKLKLMLNQAPVGFLTRKDEWLNNSSFCIRTGTAIDGWLFRSSLLFLPAVVYPNLIKILLPFILLRNSFDYCIRFNLQMLVLLHGRLMLDVGNGVVLERRTAVRWTWGAILIRQSDVVKLPLVVLRYVFGNCSACKATILLVVWRIYYGGGLEWSMRLHYKINNNGWLRP